MIREEFVIRRMDPVDNKDNNHTPLYGEEDLNTLLCKKLFSGITMEANTFTKINHRVLSYDVVSDIDSHCYIRTIEEIPGRYTESWREPSIDEYGEFIKVLIKSNSKYKDDIIYKEYISKSRDDKFNKLN